VPCWQPTPQDSEPTTTGVGAAAPTVVAGDGVTIIPPKPLVGAASMLSSGHLQVVFDQL
jgi:hypothetical protein